MDRRDVNLIIGSLSRLVSRWPRLVRLNFPTAVRLVQVVSTLN